MKRYLKYILAFMILVMAGLSLSAAETADAVLRRAAAKINGANGLTASFTLDSGGKKVSGTMKAEGKKFCIESSVSSTWYDGKTMWTYNVSAGETTVMIPTAQEVAEANPLSLVNSYSGEFTAAFAKTQKAGSKTIVLTPKSKKSGYKSVHVTISESSSIPSLIVVIPSSGQKLTVSITKASFGQKLPASAFVYTKSKYPKVEIVDLR